MLQRKLRVVSPRRPADGSCWRAGSVVGPSAEGSKARDVLIKPDELESVL